TASRNRISPKREDEKNKEIEKQLKVLTLGGKNGDGAATKCLVFVSGKAMGIARTASVGSGSNLRTLPRLKPAPGVTPTVVAKTPERAITIYPGMTATAVMRVASPSRITGAKKPSEEGAAPGETHTVISAATAGSTRAVVKGVAAAQSSPTKAVD